ncbi:hypothetical protein AAG747_24495 [Rapidithrix thailandica]|uniref:Uncharacterized protein n=1 Tax=Rapidithrix thailandica TaxID=413964 RepID=A0AAW9SFK4_9BACT
MLNKKAFDGYFFEIQSETNGFFSDKWLYFMVVFDLVNILVGIFYYFPLMEQAKCAKQEFRRLV